LTGSRRPLWLPLHCAAARFARLRFVPRQPKPPRKEHQEKCHSFLTFSFSPCSLIKGTTGVSRMLARRGHRIRVALAGADASLFERYPVEGTPKLTVYREVQRASYLDLPVKTHDP
jgi:hypothetical protein